MSSCTIGGLSITYMYLYIFNYIISPTESDAG